MILKLYDIRYGHNAHIKPVRFKNFEETFRADSFYEGENILIDCGEKLDKDDFYSLLQILDCMKNFCSPFIYMPYFFGCRQHRDSNADFATMDAKLNVELLFKAGAEEIYVLDAHDEESLPGVNNLMPYDALAMYLLQSNAKIQVVVAPDKGATARAKMLAKSLGAEVVAYKKWRLGDKVQVEYKGAVDLKGKRCIIVDDILDSGSTMISVIDDLISKGANIFTVYATHCLCTQGTEKFQKRRVNVLGITGDPDEYLFINRELYCNCIPKMIEKGIEHYGE